MWSLQTAKFAKSVGHATRGSLHTCLKYGKVQDGKTIFVTPAATLHKRGLTAVNLRCSNTSPYGLSYNSIVPNQSRWKSTLDESEEAKEAVDASRQIPDFWTDRESSEQGGFYSMGKKGERLKYLAPLASLLLSPVIDLARLIRLLIKSKIK